jgi:hypothetical protein
METIKINSRLSLEERETVLVYSSVDKTWYVDTVVPKHMNKFKRQGWKQTAEYVYEDGSPCGGAFEGSERAITIRNAEKKQMSEKQMGNLVGDDDEDDDE